MKRNYKFIFLSVFCVLSSIFISCNSGIDLTNMDDSSIKLDESLIFPVGEANLSVKDVLSRFDLPSSVDTAATEILFGWKSENEIAFDTIDMVNSIKPFNKEIYPVSYDFPLGTILPAFVTNKIQIPDSINLGLNDNADNQRVDSAFVNSSSISINFNVSSDITLPADDFKIEFLFEDKTLKLESGSIPAYIPTHYGQSLIPINIGKYAIFVNGQKKIPYNIRISVLPNVPVPILSTTMFALNMKFTAVSLKVAYGYFKINETDRKTIPIPFKIEDYLPAPNLKFADPMVHITTVTNTGADMNVNFFNVNAYTEADPTNKIWAWFDNHTSNSSTQHVSGPALFGDWKTTVFNDYNSINGQIDQLFDNTNYPDMLDYQYLITSDPARTFNFSSSVSKVKVDMGIQIPLKLKGGSNYAFSDTIRNINVGNTLDMVDSAIFVLKVKNGLPLQAHYRMTFWKSTADTIPAIGGSISKISDGSTLGNLTSEYTLKAPTVDSIGTVKEILPQTIKILLNKTQVTVLKQTNFIVFHVFLDSEKSIVNGVESLNPMHITTTNTFGVKLGIFAKGSYNTNIGN